MTKKEQRAIEQQILDLNKKLEMERAMRINPLVAPDLAPPDTYNGELSRGWDAATWGREWRVIKACSSSVGHGEGWEKTTTQQPIWLYSTRLLALKATLGKKSLEFAAVLAEIQRAIAKEEDEQAGKVDIAL